MKFSMHQLRTVTFLLLISGLLGVAGCQVAPKKPSVAAPSERAAKSAEEKAEFIVGATQYERLAATAPSPQKQDYQFKAVALLIKAGQILIAKDKLKQINISGLDNNFIARRRIFEAKIANAEGHHPKALALLKRARQLRGLNPTITADIYWTRAQALAGADRAIPAVKDLITRERYIVDKTQLEENQQQLWKILYGVPERHVNAELRITRDNALKGWLELSNIVRQSAGDNQKLYRSVGEWQKKYREHPIKKDFLTMLIRPERGLIGPIKSIALVLPLNTTNNPMSSVAKAFYDGFAAMSGLDKNPNRPSVRVYDYGGNPRQAALVYKIAVESGVDLIVGPFGREAVEALTKSNTKFIPSLLIGQTNDSLHTPAPVFQFGLIPEQEAQQAAERAYLDGRRRAAILYAKNEWGERVANAFTEHCKI